jgi:NAD(P)-dependent dehydrogenase (short-subunit alcohol dehydrogenase family)
VNDHDASQGQDAVITGGSTGIGLDTARRFVEEGTYVFINGRSQAELDAAVKEIGENVTGVQGDGSKPGDRDRLHTAVADAGRHLDVVFANAAAINVARIRETTSAALFRWSATHRPRTSRARRFSWPQTGPEAGYSAFPMPSYRAFGVPTRSTTSRS